MREDTINSYRDLKVWQSSRCWVANVYRATSALPADERFGLTSQIRRAAVSVPSNIAEGLARRQTNVSLNHLAVARGSVAEVETQLLIADDLGYLDSATIDPLLRAADEIGRMITGLQRSLNQSS